MSDLLENVQMVGIPLVGIFLYPINILRTECTYLIP